MRITGSGLRLRWLHCLLLMVLICMPIHGRVRRQDVFAAVPKSLRVRLSQRLKLLIRDQRTQQWEKQYDLLSELYTRGKSRRQFIKELERHYGQGIGNRLLDFTPKAVVTQDESVEHGEWVIYGCAKLRESNRIVQLYASVNAHREKGDWFFSEVGVISPIDGKAKPCPY